jgi:hypothetical protein
VRLPARRLGCASEPRFTRVFSRTNFLRIITDGREAEASLVVFHRLLSSPRHQITRYKTQSRAVTRDALRQRRALMEIRDRVTGH